METLTWRAASFMSVLLLWPGSCTYRQEISGRGPARGNRPGSTVYRQWAKGVLTSLRRYLSRSFGSATFCNPLEMKKKDAEKREKAMAGGMSTFQVTVGLIVAV